MKRLLAILIAINLSASGLYGRSIQSLRTTGATPSVGRYQKRLNLSGRGISSLEGLGEVRNIERASIVRLDNNDISIIPEGVLAPVEENLQVLNLSNNKITTEDLRGLIGLKNLRALILNSNKIEEIPQDVLDGLPKLSFISIYDNPISVGRINQLRHQGYYVSTWPITRSNLKKAGLVAAGLAGLVLGAVEFVKSKTDARIEAFERDYVGMTLEDAKKELQSRPDFDKLTKEDKEKKARALMVQRRKELIEKGVEKRRRRQQERIDESHLLRIGLDEEKKKQEKTLKELFKLKKYKPGPTGEYIETDEPLVTEVDTDTED